MPTFDMTPQEVNDWIRCCVDANGNRTTLVPPQRGMLAYRAVKQVNRWAVPGHIVEAGVWRGGMSCLMARAQLRSDVQTNQLRGRRHVWLFDTFEGMAAPTSHDDRKSRLMYFNHTDHFCPYVDNKWCKGPLHDVQRLMHNQSTYPPSKVHYVKGPVESTLRSSSSSSDSGSDADSSDEHAQQLPMRIAVLRLDTDFYASTAAELEVLWPRLSPGGWLYIDDYFDFGGCRTAVLQWLKLSTPPNSTTSWLQHAKRAGAFDKRTRTFHVHKSRPYNASHPFQPVVHMLEASLRQ